MYKKYLYHEYIFDVITPFDIKMATPLFIALIFNLDMAYYIIFSNLYEESMMNKYCRFSLIDSTDSDRTPLEIICEKDTYLLSVLITTQKITEKSISNDILKFCMRHNTKSLIVFLTSNACSNIINNIINKTIRRECGYSFLYLIHHGLNLESCNDIETILRLDIISIEFINNFCGLSYPTFLHHIVETNNNNCDSCICINKIFTTLYETNKIT